MTPKHVGNVRFDPRRQEPDWFLSDISRSEGQQIGTPGRPENFFLRKFMSGDRPKMLFGVPKDQACHRVVFEFEITQHGFFRQIPK